MANSFDDIDLATLGRDAWAKFIEAFQALQKSDSNSSEQLDAAAFRAEMQRFQLWAINLGLYRQDHSSLDYRLRDNEVVRSFTEELLTSSIEALKEITSIIGHSDDDDESLSIVSEMRDCDASSVENEEPSNIRGDEASLSSPVMMGILNDENESMLTLHFEDMTKAIDQLYDLASQIRSPRTRKYRTDIDLYKDVDDDIKSEYVSMRKRAELQGIEEILLQARKLLVQSQTEETSFVLTEEDECLIQRLQKANHARRQQFEYWRRSKKQSVRAAFRAIKPIPVAIHNDSGPKRDTPSLVQPSEVTRSVLSSVPALPKEFVLGHNRSTYTGTSRGLTIHGPSGEKVNWPKPPVAGPKKDDFECPFCFYLCGPKYSEDAAWRSHLKHDLRPYVCTYNECAEPNLLYDSWEDWTRHEQWAHQQRVWRCSEHPQHEYVDLASYKEHVKTYHAASMHHLLSSELLQSQESVSQVCDRPCPFCQREYERPLDLQNHVAGHLESTALLSLPNLDKIDENSEAGQANSNSANRNYAESRADDFNHMEPLVFSENDLSGDIPRMTETSKELFRRKLEVESVSFVTMNEFSVEARQGYSSDLAGEWLSRLPIKLGEEGGSPSTSRSESLWNLSTASELTGLSNILSQVCSDIRKKCESGTFPDLFTELRSLQEKLQRLIETTASLQNLSDWQRLKASALRRDFENILIIMNTTTVRYEYRNPKMTSGIPRTKVAEKEVDLIRSRLTSISSQLSVLIASFAHQVEDEAVGDGEHLENSGPFESDSEGEQPTDSQTAPTSISMSFNVTGPAEHQISVPNDTPPDQQEAGSSNHWLQMVFSLSRPSTLLEDPGQPSVSFREKLPIDMAKPEERGYRNLADFVFENGDVLVGLYDNPQTSRSGILCRILSPANPKPQYWENLVSLVIERSGPFLELYLDRQTLWARLNFPDYEGLVLFYCSFLVLRFQGTTTPINYISDDHIDKEEELFAGRIVDNHYEHALRLFREEGIGVVRLQASVHTGELKGKPVWTAFITKQIHMPGWVSRDSKRVVQLAELKQFIFSDYFSPQNTSTGVFELRFIISSDAKDFMESIEDLRKDTQTVDVK